MAKFSLISFKQHHVLKVMTDVQPKTKTTGVIWFIVCFVIGGGAGWIQGALGMILPGFKKFKHNCPYCR